MNLFDQICIFFSPSTQIIWEKDDAGELLIQNTLFKDKDPENNPVVKAFKETKL